MLMACLGGFCMVLALVVSLFANLTYALSDMVTIGRNYFFGVCGVVASAHPADLRGGGGWPILTGSGLSDNASLW